MIDKSLLRNLALQNAIRYNGKANPGAVIGHMLGSHPDLRQQMDVLKREVMAAIAVVNKIPVDEQRKELEQSAPELLEKKHEKKELSELPNAVPGKVVMRFEPSPSGPLHIGHAFIVSLNYLYCKKYNGKFILRIGDTNPENIYPKAYTMIEDDMRWLCNNEIHEVAIQSERMELYYKTMENLLNIEKAYICTCNPDAFKELLKKGEACPCRKKNSECGH